MIPKLSPIPLLISRLLNEEEVLLRELPGYKEYCRNNEVPFDSIYLLKFRKRIARMRKDL